ncbi:MAG: hypothetical protein HC880_13305, partial [Bacteroidia bacterium]|nr:hypothetical protein [Bacteroidia bacterium]
MMLLLWATTGGAEIIPTPKKVEYVPGTYQLKEVITVGIVNGGSVELLSAAKAINLALKTKMGAHTYLETDPLKADILLKIIPESQALSMAFPPDKLQDAYQLTITPQNILIEAPFIQGVFYGAGSLVQLIEQASVPAI